MTNISFATLVSQSKHRHVFMMIGHGSKNQFKNVKELKSTIHNIAQELPYHSIVLYFLRHTRC